MKMPLSLMENLNELSKRVPASKRKHFLGSVTQRFDRLNDSNLLSYTVIGAAVGALLDLLPLGDDWVEVGAALGAWIGHTKNKRERKIREQIRSIVEEELRNAMA